MHIAAATALLWQAGFLQETFYVEAKLD